MKMASLPVLLLTLLAGCGGGTDGTTADNGTLSTTATPSASGGAAGTGSQSTTTGATVSSPYSLVDIGQLGLVMKAAGLDDQGDVVGSFGPNGHAFVYDRASGSLVDLGDGAAAGINDAGMIVGNQQDSSNLNSPPYPTVWLLSGGVVHLPTVSGQLGAAAAIDSSGSIVGYVGNDIFDTTGVEWGSSTAAPQEMSGGFMGIPTSISGNGAYVGGYVPQGLQNVCGGSLEGLATAIVYANGQANLVGDGGSAVYGINNLGQAVGYGTVVYFEGPQQGQFVCLVSPHAILWLSGNTTDLGTLTGDPTLTSSAAAINDSSEIVGTSDIAAGVPHAFFYVNGQMQDLNDLTGSSSVTLTEAVAINCNGDIAANAVSSDGTHAHAYLLLRNGPHRSGCPQ